MSSTTGVSPGRGRTALANDLDRLTADQRAALTGPGAPFELTRETVRGTEMPVFAHRARHLPDLLRAAADRHAGHPYLVFGDRTLTFAETVEVVGTLATRLRHTYGVGRGDRVAVASANTLEHALTIWAVAWLGAVTVELNGWWTGDELRYGVTLTEPVLLVGDEQRLRRLADVAGAAVPTASLAQLLSALEVAAPAALLEPALDEDDAVAILFTSGTTGRPKGAIISHRGLVNMAMDGQLRGAVDALTSGTVQPMTAPTTLLPSPFFHISGLGPLLASAPLSGMTVVLPPAGRWDPAVQLELTSTHGVTNWAGVPTQLIRILRHPDLPHHDLSTLRGIGLGGAPISPELTTLLALELPQVRPTMGFGMTETCGLGTTISGGRLIANPQSIGVMSPTTEVVLRDAAGRDLADDAAETVGEIWIRCPSTTPGYWLDPGATAAAVDGDGWYRTGDFGRIVDGMLQLESRLRDLIIRGGENVYPIEIENRLSEHPDLMDAAVIGVPHDELGQEVMAVVVVRDGADVTADGVRRWVARTLAPFKVPAHVRFVDSLPYGATGKLLKREVERLVMP